MMLVLVILAIVMFDEGSTPLCPPTSYARGSIRRAAFERWLSQMIILPQARIRLPRAVSGTRTSATQQPCGPGERDTE